MNHPGRPVVELDFQEQFRKAILGISVTRREDGSFVAVNPAFARMFGYGSVEEFMAAVRDVRSLYADPEERARVVATLERYGEVRDLEVRMRRRDGELRWIGGCLLALEGGLIQAAVLDTTDKRLARERELELQGLEHLVTLRFSQARNLGEALRSAMRAICETERWEAARYVYVDEERGVLRAGESWSIDDPQRRRYLEESSTMEYRPGQGLLGHVWKTGEPLWVPDIGADPRVARPGLAAQTGMRGSVVFPVHAEGKTIGVLIFDSREVREPDDRLMRALTVIGGQIGLLVRRLQAEQALRESESRFRSLSELSSDWFWETDAAHRFTSPPTRIIDITGYGAGHYVGKARWEVEGLSPLAGDWSEHRALLERRESFRDLELLHVAKDGGRHYLAISGEPVVGADGKLRGYRGTAKDITARKREEELLRLEHAATRGLSEAVSEAEGLAGVLREICQSQGWEAGRYFSVDEAAGALRFVEAWGRDTPEVREYLERSRGRTYARGEGLSGWAWEKEAPVWVADVSRDPRASGSAGRLRGGAMVLPVRAQGRVIGVLSFARTEQSAPEERLLKGLNAIASQVGLFIQRVRGEAAVAASERKFRALIEHGADAIQLYDRELRMTYRTPSAQRISGYSESERLGGGFFDGVLEEDRPAMQAIVGTLLQASGRSAPFRCRIRRKDGGECWIEGVATNLLDEPAVGALVVNYRDIDERMRYESRIEHLASHDALTGLPNRNLLRDRVEQAIAQARRTRGHVALMYVDLDQFKLVNDSYGHRAGDALLLEIGARLRATVREGDTVARLGGDEFVVLLTSLSQADDCTVVASKIAAALARPISVGARDLQATASIGIALFPEDGGDLESLLQCADVAMYRAKEAGRNGYQYYSAEMGAHARARVELETGLRQALERGELRLHWQPQVQLASGTVSGCEALLRWDRPARGLVSPAQFIPVAEESGLIVPIGAWALHSACQEAASWAAAGLGRVKVAVNLSARQFWQGSVVETVRAALGESGLDPDCLELEITESVVARDIDKVVKALEQLRRMGVSTAIDDFGTGYSSLAYLRTLPIQKLKIDRYFIEGIPGDREAAALVAEIIRLAHVLSLEVVAEGVETHAQAAFLRDAGCEAMQGFLFSRPVPSPEFTAMLRARRALVIDPSA